MALVKINWRPDAADLRKFGAVILVGFVAIGALQYFGIWPFSANERRGIILSLIGVVVGGVGLTGTSAALPLYWAWMGLAFVLGNVMSRVILTLVFYLVVTPIGLIGRLVGRDKLQLKDPGEGSLWQDLADMKNADWERQS